MEKQKTRDEIEDIYKWDLTPIYKSDELWYQDLKKAKEEIKKVTSYKDTFLKSANNLLSFLKYDEATERLLYRLYYYAHLNSDSDTTNTKYQSMITEIGDLLNDYSTLSAFVTPSFMNTDYKIIEQYLNELDELKEYKHLIEEIYRYQEHTLTEEQEKMLSIIAKPLENASDTYEALTDSDMTFGELTLSDGKKIEMTDSNYGIYVKDKDRRVRKDAFELMYNTYANFKNTITKTYLGDIDSNIALAKVKKYNSAIEASLFSDNVDLTIYNNLIKTVKNNLNVLYKYYDLKKEMLSLDELHLYDIYADLIPSLDKKYTFLEAKEEVLDALNVLGEDYINNANRAFKENWIDIYNNKGKRGGAYSSGFYDTNPYILLNYEGQLHDVSTLAHELGHSMHTYYSCKNNKYIYSSYKIFVAEVASTVNEILLAKNMLKKSESKEEKLNILNSLMELFKGTIYRQTMFAEFEKIIYEKRENGESLTHENISQIYYDLNKEYFGEDVVVDDLIKYEWERIPHFYYNFYVYKYATGLSAACYIADGILNVRENALENYIKFLSSGSSDYPVNELKIAGVDMENPEVIESAIKMFDDTIEEFKILIEK